MRNAATKETIEGTWQRISDNITIGANNENIGHWRGERGREYTIVKHIGVKFIIKQVMETKDEHDRQASTLYSTIV